MTPWIFLRYLILPLLVIGGNLLGGWWNFTVPAICFVIHPIAGLMVKKRKASEPEHHSHSSYRAVALIFVPVLLFTTAWAIIRSVETPVSVISVTGLYISTGIMNGIIGFTLAHEFIHRQNKWDRLAGHLLLLQNNYLHYSIEHIGGHHVYACTVQDPHTARMNESFYRFLPRAIAGTFNNACRIESRRLKRSARSVISNRMLHFILLQLSVYTLIGITLGWFAVIFFLLQSFVAVFLLHVTNYLQHYGMLRGIVEGKHERINEHHAWRTKMANDGLNLFQLENHADHHMHPNRSYELLERHDESPEMPAGYSGMIILAMIPALWFDIMNKRLES